MPIQLSSSDSVFYLIDASGFLFRSFFALPCLTTSKNRPIGALLGVCNMLLKLWEEHNFTHWTLVLDSKEPTFRHELMPSYKSQRKTPPEALLEQFSFLPHLCESFSIPYIVCPGFEADDLMISYGKWGEKFAKKICLISSDKDLMQAITPKILMYDPVKELWIDQETVKTLWGVVPEKIPDIQALSGDACDHIPGIPGVGLKTAKLWIQEAGDLEAVLQGKLKVLSHHKKKLINDFQDQARLCYRMTCLRDDVPIIHSDFEYFKRCTPDSQKLEHFIDQLELRRLKGRLTDLGWLRKKIPTAVSVKFWTSTDLLRQSSVYISWVQDKEERIFGAFLKFYDLDFLIFVPFSDFETSEWKNFWNQEKNLKIFWDALAVLRKLNKDMSSSIEDLRLLEYIARGCHSSDTSQQTLLQCGIEVKDLDVQWDSSISEKFHHTKAVQEAFFGIQAYQIYKNRLKDAEMEELYETLDLPLMGCLQKMEQKGIALDVLILQELSSKLLKKMKALEEKIYIEIGKSINLASPKKLSEVLFQDLGWPASKKGKSGQYSTDSGVLEEYVLKGYSLAQDILDWRHYAKLKQSYTDALPEQINLDTKRIHSRFSMVTTSTGRLASFHPNLQHIPISSEFPIRSAFHSAPGYFFLSLDYSQIELRLLAHMGNIPSLIKAFQEGKDIHYTTAQTLFNTSEVTDEHRKYAKTINFGILYGMSAYGLAQQLRISSKEAGDYIHRYFELYPGVKDYMKQVEEHAKQTGYVCTLWGRKCAILDIHSSSSTIRQGASRQAINAPLQGTCADFMKKAMLECQKIIGHTSYLLLQIHDELLLEVPEECVEKLAHTLQSVMEQVAYLKVPLQVNYYWGKVWGEKNIAH
ncbi:MULTISPECIES: DNA polymerase I [Holospora]|uniref:DNA polymerase I n=2 Tax=Holospora TaxID=44747 RepID=A0A061JIQ9_9PROT|nr:MULTISPECIES: DNA polymerase I [Holospora]ETZ05538.1 DNA polymerase I [Holospora undulata HU1]GAJ46490.1 DNA polymerase I [Holospora elegans E1]